MEGQGTQFDPIITDALINTQDRFRRISEQYT
jgi:response regulator RpfG family c-di-GMP phosphodiesterase